MLIKPINLFFDFKIKYNATNHAALNTQQIQNNNSKTDTLTALAFRGNENLAAIKKHETVHEIDTVINNFRASEQIANTLAQSLQKQANSAAEYAKDISEEVTELFKKGDETTSDGIVLRNITDNGTNKIMREYNQEGALTRMSIFEGGRLEMIQEGIEEFPDGRVKTARRLSFENEQLCGYEEDIEKNIDESEKIAKALHMWNGKPTFYMEGIEELSDGSKKVSGQIGIVRSRNTYAQGFEILQDGSRRIARRLDFNNRKPTLYQEGVEINFDAPSKIAKEINFTDGKPVKYIKDYTELIDGSIKIAKQLKLTDKGWQEISE